MKTCYDHLPQPEVFILDPMTHCVALSVLKHTGVELIVISEAIVFSVMHPSRGFCLWFMKEALERRN